jgi:hypothetical protein
MSEGDNVPGRASIRNRGDPSKRRVSSRPARYKDDRTTAQTLSSSARKPPSSSVAPTVTTTVTTPKKRGPYKPRAAKTELAVEKKVRGPGRKSLGDAIKTPSARPMIRLNLKAVDRFSGIIKGKDAEISPYCPSHVDLKAFDETKALALVSLRD